MLHQYLSSKIILRLQDYWDRQGCALLQPYDMEVGAGTSHTATFLRALGPEPWKAAYVQPSRRPKDGRYGENPEPPAALLPVPGGAQAGAGQHPRALPRLAGGAGLRPEGTTSASSGRLGEPDAGLLGPGLGGLAQRHGGDAVHLLPAGRRHRLQAITGEITYGLERLAMYLQGVDNVYDLQWTTDRP